MQLSYSWLNSFFREKSEEYNSTTIYSPKLKGLLYKRLDRDEMNAVRSAVYAVKVIHG